MTKTPSIGYDELIKTLRRIGWVTVRQKNFRTSAQHTNKNSKDFSSPIIFL